jgi:hypothetical protein
MRRPRPTKRRGPVKGVVASLRDTSAYRARAAATTPSAYALTGRMLMSADARFQQATAR